LRRFAHAIAKHAVRYVQARSSPRCKSKPGWRTGAVLGKSGIVFGKLLRRGGANPPLDTGLKMQKIPFGCWRVRFNAPVSAAMRAALRHPRRWVAVSLTCCSVGSSQVQGIE
jgi:hypothetical protein